MTVRCYCGCCTVLHSPTVQIIIVAGFAGLQITQGGSRAPQRAASAAPGGASAEPLPAAWRAAGRERRRAQGRVQELGEFRLRVLREIADTSVPDPLRRVSIVLGLSSWNVLEDKNGLCPTPPELA